MSSVNTVFGKSDTPVKFYNSGKRISVDTAFGMYQKAVQFGSKYVLTVSGLPITNKVDKLTKVLEKRLAPGKVVLGLSGRLTDGRAQVTFIGPTSLARGQKKLPDGYQFDRKHRLKVTGPYVRKLVMPNNALFKRLQGGIVQFLRKK